MRFSQDDTFESCRFYVCQNTANSLSHPHRLFCSSIKGVFLNNTTRKCIIHIPHFFPKFVKRIQYVHACNYRASNKVLDILKYCDFMLTELNID